MKCEWHDRRCSISQAAHLLHQTEHWVRQQLKLRIVPERRQEQTDGRSPIIYLTMPDVAALAVSNSVQERYPMLPLAKAIAGVIHGLSIEEFQAAAENDMFAAATACGSLPAGLYTRGQRVEKAQPDNWRDPLVWIGLRDLWNRVKVSLDTYDRQALTPALSEQ